MKSSALEGKTIRPGLMQYSYYASARQQSRSHPKIKTTPHRHGFVLILLIGILLAGAGAVYAAWPKQQPAKAVANAVTATNKSETAAKPPHTAPAPAAAPVTDNHCSGNTLDEEIKVSISARHLWACQGVQSVYDSPVVTGIEYLAADKTPIGTYHIYGKYTDTVLTGSDSTGSWRDPVSYWMPFMRNQYGTYGLHDATWRSASDFGNIDPDSSSASHGCVELPLSAAKWLYDWASVGTTVVIES